MARCLVLLLCMKIVGCGRKPHREALPDPTAPAPKPAAVSATACAVVMKSHSDAVARIRGEAGADLNLVLDHLPSLLGRCWPTLRGAYGFVLDELCVEKTVFNDGHPPADVLGRWRFIHVDASGHVATYPSRPGGVSACGGRIDHLDSMTIVGRRDDPESLQKARAPLLFDYDADGEEEVLVDLSGSVVQDAPESGDLALYTTDGIQLVTFRDGAIVPLPSTKSLALEGSARDVDGDGRLDLRIHRHLLADYERSWTDVPLPFYAHTLPGGAFAIDDDAALSAARAACSATAGALVSRQPSGALDANRTIANVVCAKLSGATLESIKGKLESDCAAASKDAACRSLVAQCLRGIAKF